MSFDEHTSSSDEDLMTDDDSFYLEDIRFFAHVNFIKYDGKLIPYEFSFVEIDPDYFFDGLQKAIHVNVDFTKKRFNGSVGKNVKLFGCVQDYQYFKKGRYGEVPLMKLEKYALELFKEELNSPESIAVAGQEQYDFFVNVCKLPCKVLDLEADERAAPWLHTTLPSYDCFCMSVKDPPTEFLCGFHRDERNAECATIQAWLCARNVFMKRG